MESIRTLFLKLKTRELFLSSETMANFFCIIKKEKKREKICFYFLHVSFFSIYLFYIFFVIPRVPPCRVPSSIPPSLLFWVVPPTTTVTPTLSHQVSTALVSSFPTGPRQECSHFSTFWPAYAVTWVYDLSHSDLCRTESQVCFELHFYNE